jgi:uncharacterized membrane protein
LQKFFPKWSAIPKHWQLLILVCLIAGLIFRWVNLGKVYWYDETFTSLRISGYTEAEAVQALSPQKLVEPSAFREFQQINPAKGLANTVNGLAKEEPQHTPLYFVLVRLWASLFGDSVTAIRIVSVVLSLLALPCMGWLCWELYQSAGAAWIGTALLAVSPFQIVYAQEARPTALWVTTILLSSAALLRALRVQTPRSWLIYALCLTINLYAFLFSSLVAIVHTVYVIVVERGRWTANLKRFVLALLISIVAFAPWLIMLKLNASQVDTATNWLTGASRFSLGDFVKLWSYHLILPFVDRGSFSLPTGIKLLFVLLQVLVRLLLLYGLYLLCRRTPLRTWLFVVLLIGIPALALTLPDILLGGKRSTIPRYVVPVYLGLELLMTYAVTQYLLPAVGRGRWRQRILQLAAVLVFGAGILSSSLIAQSSAWWNKGHNSRMFDITRQINQTERPLIVSNAELGDLLAISRYLDPKVRLLMQPACLTCGFNREQLEQLQLPSIPAGYSDVFLYNPRPTDTWLSQLQQQKTYQVETLSEVKGDWNTEYWLWKLK